MNIGHKIAATGLFLAASLTPLTSFSQNRCSEDGYAIVERLKAEPYFEELKATATNSHGNRVLWLANDETGTWSQIVVLPPAVYGQPSPGCLIGSGFNWFFELVPPLGDSS